MAGCVSAVHPGRCECGRRSGLVMWAWCLFGLASAACARLRLCLHRAAPAWHGDRAGLPCPGKALTAAVCVRACVMRTPVDRSIGRPQVIGATTLDEHRKYIERDPALERRFQPVQVDEPSPEATLQILTVSRTAENMRTARVRSAAAR